MKTIEWAAGLFEGEGCFTVGHKGNYKQFSASLEMTDEDVVKAFQEVVSVGTIVARKKVYGNRKPSWRWKVGSKADFVLFAKLMHDHMCSRRQARISELLAELEEYENQ